VSRPRWPEEPVRPARLEWRETLTLAADLALVGVLLTAGTVLVVPAGGAVATASYAIDHWCEHRSWPRLADLGATFRRAFWPGLAAFAVAVVAIALLVLDFSALARGLVPGGRPLLLLTALVEAALVAAAP
jgi:hypothetical protein